jgi:hypothetical protein
MHTGACQLPGGMLTNRRTEHDDLAGESTLFDLWNKTGGELLTQIEIEKYQIERRGTERLQRFYGRPTVCQMETRFSRQ